MRRRAFTAASFVALAAMLLTAGAARGDEPAPTRAPAAQPQPQPEVRPQPQPQPQPNPAFEAQAQVELLAMRVFLRDAVRERGPLALAESDPAALAARALAHARAYAAASAEHRDFERAVAALIACLAGDDDDLDPAVEALRRLPKALPLPSFRVSLCLAHAYRRRGMLPQALFFAEKALVLAPQSLEARRLKRAILAGLEARR